MIPRELSQKFLRLTRSEKLFDLVLIDHHIILSMKKQDTAFYISHMR